MSEVNPGVAQAWFVAGTIPFLFAGGLHALLALTDTARPRYFAPRDRSVKPALEGTRIRFGGDAAPSMWRAWLGFSISHGLGVFTFGLLCLLIAIHDSKYGPAILTGSATACFIVDAARSA